ncbi:MAG: DUF4326 domain-containing protein [Deltaproteobacteria bacterium]|nr:DUF4326 domain-containing protein [Deltaproteobacteria bacterium]
MKCLSIPQPGASLIVAGFQDVENRSWATKYRGPVLIHAAKRPGFCLRCSEGCECLSTWFQVGSEAQAWTCQAVKARQGQDYPLGAIIGQAEIIDCVQGHPSRWAEPGAWHWVLTNAKPFPGPVPYPGRLGLFEAPDPDADHLFKPHDGRTRRVCIAEEPADIMITRPRKWGNPYRLEPVNKKYGGTGWYVDGIYWCSKEEALKYSVWLYRDWIVSQPELEDELRTLKGKRLGCFCAPGEPCHGDVLVRLVEEMA